MTPWEAVEYVLNYHHHKPDLQAARVVYSAVAAHELTGVRVWLINIAPPGSMKTELIDGLKGQPKFHSVDKIIRLPSFRARLKTRKKGQALAALRFCIASALVALWASLISARYSPCAMRAGTLFRLRRIYDGEIHKEFGVRSE